MASFRNIKIPTDLVLKGIYAVGGLGALGYVGMESLYTVDGGHRAVIYSRWSGIQDQVYGEGTHFKLPWFERPIFYDIRTRPHTRQSLTGTRDLQMVNVTLRVLTRPQARDLPKIYRRLGENYDERVLPSIVNEVVKQVIAKFTAAQLLTMREQVSGMVRQNLLERSQEFWITLEDVSITDLTFGQDFMKAVEMKQVAQQEAERAKFIVLQALQEKKSNIIKAQGEARSAELIGMAVAENPAFIELRRIEAAREIAQTVSKSNNKIFLQTDSLLLNLMADSGADARMQSQNTANKSAK